MRILVTGATGSLGFPACERLLDWGIDVHGLARSDEKASFLQARGMQFSALDLVTDRHLLPQVLKNTDAIWHCAGLSSTWGDPQDLYLNNIQATQNLLRAAVGAGVRKFIFVSSAAVYFDYRDRLAVQEAFLPKEFANSFAKSKRMTEVLIAAATQDSRGALKSVVLRPAPIFGPRDRGFIPRLLQVAWRRSGTLPLPYGGRALIDLTYTDNVVDAMWLATLTPGLSDFEVFNVSNDEPWMFDRAITALADGLVSPFAIKTASYHAMYCAAVLREAWSAYRGKEPSLTQYGVASLAYHQTLDISRARKLLGYRPSVSMQQGIDRTLAALTGREEL